MSKRIREIAGCIVSTVCLGCANHLEFVESTLNDTRENVLESAFVVRGPTQLVQDARLELQFIRRQRVELATRQRVVKSSRETPYLVERELIEVPLGLASLPVALALDLIDVASLGALPNRVTYDYTAWAFAAVNPAMNAEDPTRSIQRELEGRDQPLVVESVTRDVPVVAGTVYVGFGGEAGGIVRSFELDESGRVEADLIDLLPDQLSSAPQRVIAELHLPQSEQPDAARMLYLERTLAHRLFQAVPILAAIRKPLATPDELAASIYILDGIGFPGRAAQLRDQIAFRFRRDDVALRAFEQALDARYVNPAGVTPWGREEADHLNEPADLDR